jgi:hypothetical protein
VNRREIIAGLTLPLLTGGAWAQQTGRVRRLGWLSNTPTDNSPERQAINDAFRGHSRLPI